jgi:hypothetical protein
MRTSSRAGSRSRTGTITRGKYLFGDTSSTTS